MSRRREFIRQVSLGGLGLSLTPFHAFKQLVPKARNGKPLRILFQRDSITDGGRERNSSDWNHLVGQSYPYLISAKIGFDYPQRNLQFFNRGVSGSTVADPKARWQKDSLDIKPDVLSILVGINEVSRLIRSQPNTGTVKSFEEDYRTILQQARAANGDLVLVLLDPFVFNFAKAASNFDRYEKELSLRRKAVKGLAAEFKAIHIPVWDKFRRAEKQAPAQHWSWDGIHPMPAGHELIARAWIGAVSKVIGVY